MKSTTAQTSNIKSQNYEEVMNPVFDDARENNEFNGLNRYTL